MIDKIDTILKVKNLINESNILATNLFENFSDDFIKRFDQLGNRKFYKAQSIVLQEGDYNKIIFIILSGNLNIIFEDEHIATLKTNGDMICEIGLLTKLPSSAIFKADTDLEIFEINYEEILNKHSNLTSQFLSLIHQLFSNLLSIKLMGIDKKAKQFERKSIQLEISKEELEKANTDLEQKAGEINNDISSKTCELVKLHKELDQQKTTLVVSSKKIEDLYNNKSATLSKLHKLYSVHLKKLKESLPNQSFSSPEIFKDSIDKISAEISSVMNQLRPLSELFITESTLKTQKLLVIEKNKKQQTITKMALGGTGVKLDIATSTNDCNSLLKKNQYDMVMYNTDHMNLAKEIYKISPLTKQVLITSDKIPNYLHELKNMSYINNIISKNDDRTFTVKNIFTTINKITSKDIFGLEHYLSWGIDVQSIPVTNSKTRKLLIMDMKDYFHELGIRSTVIEKCQFVAEELLMNIIYDAPVDSSGNSLYNHLPRTIPIHLKEHEEGLLRYATDGVLAAVSTQDPFGALTKDTILNYLESCYGGQAGTLNKDKGGGGRGIYQIIEIADVVIFNVCPNLKTEVIALFNLDIKTSKKIKNPSFHLFFV